MVDSSTGWTQRLPITLAAAALTGRLFKLILGLRPITQRIYDYDISNTIKSINVY